VHIGFLWEDLCERTHFDCPGLDGKTNLKSIFKQWDGEAYSGFIWLTTGIGADSCEYVNENSGSIK
jgi:hypothetical protein